MSHAASNSGAVRRKPLDVEDLLAVVLRWGVFLSGAVILAGFVLLMAAPATGAPAAVTSVPLIWAAARRGDPNGIIMVGLLLLMATPIARVAFAGLSFLIRGERRHVLISAGVFLVLLLGLATGRGHA